MQMKKKRNLNIVFLGHVDSGKSTLIGHLMYLTGFVSKSKIQENQITCKQYGKSTFKYAWLTDKLRQERLRGISYDMKTKGIQTQDKILTLIDTPGVGSFMKNLVVGLSEADVAILVVAGNLEEFQIGMSKYGYTTQHAKAAYCLGIKQLIVCINKFELINDQVERYGFVKTKMEEMLKKIGFDLNRIKFLPISAYQGLNLTSKSDRFPFYEGQSLIDMLKNIQIQPLNENKPLRISIHETYDIFRTGTVLAGKILSGTLKVGTKLKIIPGNYVTQVRSIQMHNKVIKEGWAGDNVAFNVTNLHHRKVKRGSICGQLQKDPPKIIQSFVAQVRIFDIPNFIKNGFCPMLHLYTARFACRFKKILSAVDRRTGKQLQKEPKKVLANQVIFVEMEPTQQISLSNFHNNPSMGRFIVRDQNKIIGWGIVKETQQKVEKNKK